MVVRISSGTNPTGAVYYNETKVEKGEAERLAVRNYEGIDTPLDQLRLGVIAAQLEDRADLNDRVKKPTFHVSLSLAQDEKPEADELIALADRYMDGMGYAKQPYVVYQHFDTDHSHIHIVSVRIDENARKIPDNYERERSNKLRKQIEQEFGLQVAEKAALKPERKELLPVEYGKGDLKRDVSTVVNGVLKDFTFSSFSQFNQLLGLYNVKATEIPLTDRKPGLVYSVVDANNLNQTPPYKASSLPLQPTMDTVSRRINAGKKVKGDKVVNLRKATTAVLEQSRGWDDFQQRLSRIGVEVIPHLGKDQNLFGISFIDTRQRAIYTGSELSKSFTAGSLKTTLGETYTPPTLREVAEPVRAVDAPDRSHEHKQTPGQNRDNELTHQSTETQTPMHNASLIRQMLYAIGELDGGDENDQELKQMLKRSRKPRQS